MWWAFCKRCKELDVLPKDHTVSRETQRARDQWVNLHMALTNHPLDEITLWSD